MNQQFQASMPDPFDLDPNEYRRLLANVLMGDGVAERTLVSRVGPLVRRVVSRLAPPDLREDLIQDVWAHFWARNCLVLQRWDGRGPFVHYVATVAGNLAKDRLRRLPRPAAPIEEAPEIADPDDPEQTLETRQLAECLDRAKGRLSETYRRMIHLRHELGLSHREIADNLDKTMGYVAGTLARAERYLRDELWETCRDHLERFGAIFGRNE
jgi:RNA polymerase sigma factor (sigma-70 family)